jgi:hypothetical protein
VLIVQLNNHAKLPWSRYPTPRGGHTYFTFGKPASPSRCSGPLQTPPMVKIPHTKGHTYFTVGRQASPSRCSGPLQTPPMVKIPHTKGHTYFMEDQLHQVDVAVPFRPHPWSIYLTPRGIHTSWKTSFTKST